MALKKKVTWSSGQGPSPRNIAKMPAYFPTPEIVDQELKDAWSQIVVGQICLVTDEMNAFPSNDGLYPYPIMRQGGWYGDASVNIGQPVVYIGQTNVNCLGTKGRIISKPYATIFYNGSKYLVSDPNCLKPIGMD